MNPLRSAPLALAFAVSSAGVAHAQTPSAPSAEQQKEIDAAREDLSRAAKRLAELTRRYGGQNFRFELPPLAKKPVIGVLLAPDPQGGVRIAGVTPDGPAADAGIRTGDRLLRIGGKPIAGDSPEARVEAARKALQSGDEKTPVSLTYARDGREQQVSVTPKLDQRIMLFAGEGQMLRPGANAMLRRLADGGMMLDLPEPDFDFDFDFDFELPKGAHWQGKPGEDGVFVFESGPDGAARSESRVIRIECKDKDEDCRKRAARHAAGAGAGVDGDALRHIVLRSQCAKGEDCKDRIRLAEAFRWNGLNLASVDAQLGRYFGTDKGVLVLSAGPALGSLQPGDVIRRVDGKAVETPRAVMDALRDKPADATVRVEYLRDRVPATAEIKVPERMPFPGLMEFRGDRRSGAPADVRVQRRVVTVDGDGKVRTWEDDGDGKADAAPGKTD